MKRLFAFLIVTVLCSFTMSAARQDNIVSAKLVDKNDGSALGWATVAVRDVEGNITACTTTDENGKFQVNLAHPELRTRLRTKQRIIRL